MSNPIPKKILVLVSNPKGTSNLNLLPEIRDLQEALQRSLNRERFTVEWRVAKLQTDLRRYILDVKPNIIHFCGHGTEQGLVLEDDTGKAKVGSNEFLTDLLRVFADRIECVLLNACDSECLADQLVQHLNYVIGMNQEVRDDAAISFAEGFYDTLGAGESYEQAFEIGKNAVLGKVDSRLASSRKVTVVGADGKPVKVQNREHLIPVLKINLHPKTINLLWLSSEAERDAVRLLLGAIASSFNTIKLFHTDEPIVLKDQYIPVQVTLVRRYKHSVETIGGYAESEAELKRIYAMKGSSEEEIKEEIKKQQVDWEEGRRQHSRIMVLADPGMGKSTLLRREVGTTVQEAYKVLEAGKPLQDITLPLLIRLSTLADEIVAMPIEEAILKTIQERHSNLLKHHENTEVMTFLNEFLNQQLWNGKGLLLLDALDEVPDGKRPKLLEKLNDFAKAYQTCPMIGTSRIVGYGGRLVDGAKDVEIVPFTQKQTEEYIEKWFEYAPLRDESVSARGLVQALRERPQIAGLAQNPLLLSLICSLYQRDQLTLPARLAQIYEQAVNCMLGEWNQTRPDYDDNRTTAKTRLLEELAYYFTSEVGEVIEYEDLYDWVESYLEEGDAPRDLWDAKTGELIAELSEEDGILQKLYRDKNDDQYLFLHRTFQEYFTASYLKRAIKKNKKNPSYVTELVRNYNWNYDWHETLTLLARLMDNPMVLIEAIAAEKDDIFQTQLLLAGRCLAECREMSHPLVEELIDRIFQFWQKYLEAEFIRSVVVAIGQFFEKIVHNAVSVLYNNADINVTRQVVSVLVKIDSEKVVDAFINALNDKDFSPQVEVAEALCAIGSDKATDALINALNDDDDDDWNVRRKTKVAEALGVIGSDKAIDTLINALNHEYGDVRMQTERSLVKIGSDKAINALIDVLNDVDRDDSLKAKAASVLGSIRSDKAVDALINALKNRELRWHAVSALGMIGSDTATDALINALNYGDWNFRGRAAKALGAIKSDTATDALINALNHVEPQVISNVAEALGDIGSDKAVNALINALNDKDSDDRRKGAVGALVRFDSDKVVDALMNALNDKVGYVRVRAIEALVRFDSNKVVDALMNALNDKEKYVKLRAIEALGRIKSDKVVDALMNALNDEETEVKGEAALALGAIGNDKAVDALFAALKHNDRVYYISYSRPTQALGHIGSDKAIDALVKALDHEDNIVRREAISGLSMIAERRLDSVILHSLERDAVPALGMISSDTVIDALITALNDKDEYVKAYSAQALGKIGSNKADDALINALNDKDKPVKILAAVALGRMRNNKAVDALINSLNDVDTEVQQAVAGALCEIGSEKAVDALINSLNESNVSVRRNVVSTLGRIDSDKAFDALVNALNNTDSHVKTLAVEALSRLDIDKLDSDNVVNALINVLNDDDSIASDRAVKALEKIGSQTCLEKLIKYPELDIFRREFFFLARKLTIRFSNAGLPFIPVYSERLNPKGSAKASGIDNL